MHNVSFSSSLKPSSNVIVIIAAKDNATHPHVQKADAMTNGAVSAVLGKKEEQTCYTLYTVAQDTVDYVLLYIITTEPSSEKDWQTIGGDIFGNLNKKCKSNVDILIGLSDYPSYAHGHLGYGICLADYHFNRYKTVDIDKHNHLIESYNIICYDQPQTHESMFKTLYEMVLSVHWTRNLVSEPSNILYPESYADNIEEILTPLGVKVTVLGEEEIRELSMGSLYAVGQGSYKESKVVVMEWLNNPQSKNNIALAGKGVTFDTGGISLKPSANMHDMKYDMGGSATVVGTMRAIAGQKIKANVIAAIGLVENMPSGNAIKPGDIVTSMSGQTIEVLNTDAEGRLVLADIITYLERRFQPDILIDLATLTGAVTVALGDKYAAILSNDQELCDDLTEAGLQSNEPLWQLPLPKEYDKRMNSVIADIQNIRSISGAGTITAAIFLQRFVEKSKWAHLDIAAVTWQKKSDIKISPNGATGFGVRLLESYIRKYFNDILVY